MNANAAGSRSMSRLDVLHAALGEDLPVGGAVAQVAPNITTFSAE